MKDVPKELLDFIKTGNIFLVAGHRDPDGDCVGSQLALCSALSRLGKEAYPCSAGPFKRSEVKPYEKFFVSAPDKVNREGARVIITDCGSLDRTGDLGPFLENLPTAFIDHHERGNNVAEDQSGPLYISDDAPSVTLMILTLIRALGRETSREEAEFLLFGLCTDTGFFRHGDEDSAATFEAAARLTYAGASPKKTYAAIHGGKSLGSRYLLGRVLCRAETHFGGKLILSSEEYEETQIYGQEGRDSDSLYQLLQSITGVEAIVIIRQEKPDNCTVGLRSRDEVDVAAVARSLGGGGHKNAAGFSLAGTIPELKIRILDEFRRIFP